ncbi:MAG: DHA2 family efflux MFS transporter permease subunit [Nevskia sp.]|nr:DHA2 family efflux MFS transporter permease subunit [Nevskia sp.]
MNQLLPAPHAAMPAQERQRRRREWAGYMAMVIGNFMAVLDVQIVASSINEIQAGLSASPDEIQWVQTSYLIAEVIGVPLSGYLSRMLSTRVYFVACSLGFVLASLGCAASWSLGSMVVFRLLQGLLGAGMIPTTFATLFILFPEQQRRILPRVLLGMTTTLGSTLGPTLGGFITEFSSWHWLFLLNLAPGILCASTVWRHIDIDKPQPQMLKLTDFPGVLLMALFLGGMEYTLDTGPRKDWLSDDTVALTTAVAAVAGALFFWRTLTTEHPIVELRTMRNRNFAIGCLFAAVLGVSMYTLIYITPLFLGQVRGYNPVQIGEIMMVQGGSMFVAAPLAGRLSRVMEPRALVSVGIVLLSIGGLINVRLTADWGFWEFALLQVLRGFGNLFCMIPLTDLAMGTLGMREVKNASALYNVTRNLGGAIGLALVSTLMNHNTWAHWQGLAESTRLSREPVREALSSLTRAFTPALGNSASGAAIGRLAQMAGQQAAVMAYSDMYRLLSWGVLTLLILVPLLAKPGRHLEAEPA